MPTKQFGKSHSDLGEPKVYRAGFKLRKPKVSVDPVTFEIVSHRVQHIGLSMGETLKKVSGTIVTAEANDMSTYITLSDGAPVFLGPYIILHAAIADLVIPNVERLNKEDPGIEEGDMFFCNDPWLGVVHQPDCAVVQPIFVDDEIFLWTGITVHQLDMGGVNPGGLCPQAKDVFAEPHLYPAVKIVEKGKLRADFDRMLQRNSRMPGIVALDVRSMLAGNNTARERLLKLINQYGKDVVESVLQTILLRTRDQFKKRIAALPRGKFRGRDFFEIGGLAPELQADVYEVNCTVTNTGEKLVFDFSGTSKQSGGFVNCGNGGMRSGVVSGFAASVAHGLPWNAGILANIEIISQEGTVNNPTFPAAVSDGITEGAIATGGAVTQAINQITVCSEENRNSVISTSGANFLGNTLGGMTKEGKFWGTLLMDPIGMAGMPTALNDGKDLQGSDGIPLTQFANVETNELHYPLLYLFRRAAKDAYGFGYRRGGRALELAFKPHKTPIIYMLLFNHGTEMPNVAGISGGHPASAVRFKLARAVNFPELFAEKNIPQNLDDFKCEFLPAKCETFIGEQDIVYFCIPGGAGYGDPFLREPERVLADVREGILSVSDAKKFYGVVLKGNKIDHAVTEEERKQIRQSRFMRSLPSADWGELVPKDFPLNQPSPSRGEDKREGAEVIPLSSPFNKGGIGGFKQQKVILTVGLGLLLVSSNGQPMFACSGCGYVYCSATENPKFSARICVSHLRDSAHPTAQMTRSEKPRFFFRQFFCPSCGLQFATEVGRKEDPVLFNCELIK